MNGERRKVIMLLFELALKTGSSIGVDPFLFSDFSLAHFSIHKRNVALGLFVIIDPGSEGLTHAVTHSLAQYDT